MTPLTIIVHDYAGHPFTAELSRQLAANGHIVHHAFFAADEGPKGRNSREEGDAETLSFHAVDIDQDYSKSNFRARRSGDLAYGRKIAALIADIKPDIVLSGNTPTETQEFLVKACMSTGAKFVYWCQDFYSIAATRILSQKIPVLGGLIGKYYQFLERRQMHRAAHVVHITDGFNNQTDTWGIPRDQVSVIPNWGALEQIPRHDRDTKWAREQGLRNGTRYIYSGTLALKHNPQFLIDLAKSVGSEDEVIVIAFGVGVDTLKAAAPNLPTLRVLPLQPFDRLPEVLGSADVLVAVIERDAGEFSVPSKVLSYLCAGKPIMLAAPLENLAAQIVQGANAGLAVDCDDKDGFVTAATTLGADAQARKTKGDNGRAYAEGNFDLARVATRFEDVFTKIT